MNIKKQCGLCEKILLFQNVHALKLNLASNHTHCLEGLTPLHVVCLEYFETSLTDRVLGADFQNSCMSEKKSPLCDDFLFGTSILFAKRENCFRT